MKKFKPDQAIMKETAGSLASRKLVEIDPGDKLSTVEKRLHDTSSEYDELHYLYVINREGCLMGVLSIRDLFIHSPETKVCEIMTTNPEAVLPDIDQEQAATFALRKKLKAVPVVSREGVFYGVIPAQTIFNILSQEHSEDLFYAGGVEGVNSADGLLNAKVSSLLWARLPWLVVGLAGGLLAALVVERFEPVLEHYLALAFFLPLVVYMSDAVANQTLTIFIRALAMDRSFPVGRYILREVVVGSFIAITIGILIAVISYIWFADIEVSLILGLSLLLAIVLAVLIALGITSTLARLNKDPAVGSGPFATIIIDVLTIFLYFSIASVFFSFWI